jgi:hypothetical protein
MSRWNRGDTFRAQIFLAVTSDRLRYSFTVERVTAAGMVYARGEPDDRTDRGKPRPEQLGRITRKFRDHKGTLRESSKHSLAKFQQIFEE